MPILTKSAVVKNVPTPFTLTKSLLAALPLVSSDPYFSVQLNWNKIVLVYKSSIGEQKSIVIFEASQEVPSGDFFISSKARDFFNVERIDIYDFDNDRISIPRSALNAIEFDIDMTPVSVTALYSRNFSSPNTVQPSLDKDFAYGSYTYVSIIDNNLVMDVDNNFPYSTNYHSYQLLGASMVAGTTYKLRMYVSSYDGLADGMTFYLGDQNNSQSCTSSDLLAAVGGYVEKTFTPVNAFSNDLLFSTSKNASNPVSVLRISKIEVLNS